MCSEGLVGLNWVYNLNCRKAKKLILAQIIPTGKKCDDGSYSVRYWSMTGSHRRDGVDSVSPRYAEGLGRALANRFLQLGGG